jgi:hypothetical protein
MITFAVTEQSARPLVSAVALASFVANTVSSAVFSFARSFLPASSQKSALQYDQRRKDTSTLVSNSRTVNDATAPIQLSTHVYLNDLFRQCRSILLSPSGGFSPLAAVTDSLGRVLVIDTEEGDVVRVWKGVRDAQCAWIELPIRVDDVLAEPSAVDGINHDVKFCSSLDSIPRYTKIIVFGYLCTTKRCTGSLLDAPRAPCCAIKNW